MSLPKPHLFHTPFTLKTIINFSFLRYMIVQFARENVLKLFYKLYSKLMPNVQLMPQFHHPHPHLHANYRNQIAAAASYCTIVDPGPSDNKQQAGPN